ncbi:MAG: GIY-YIG nuclease family protein [bacterium]
MAERLLQHSSGKAVSTQHRRPLKLIYLEVCLSKVDALRREKYLKTTDGRKFLSKRLKDYYGPHTNSKLSH